MSRSKPRRADKNTSGEKAARAGYMEEDQETDEEEILEDNTDDVEVEMSEELESFIDDLVEQGLDEDEIITAIEENFDFEDEEVDEDEDEDTVLEENEPDEEDTEPYVVDMSEHVEAMFEGEDDLSEEFKGKAKTILEAAVNERVNSEIDRIEKVYAASLEEEVDKIESNLTETVENYLNYVVEQWIEDNEVALVSGLRTEITEEFISNLKQVFMESYVDVPEDKVDVVAELQEAIQEMQAELNEQIEKNVELNAILSEEGRDNVLEELSQDLADTQVEKLKSLAEGVEYTDAEDYKEKVATLKESYFPETIVEADGPVDAEEKTADGRVLVEESTDRMEKYVHTLGAKSPS
jgi:hypothetical protein